MKRIIAVCVCLLVLFVSGESVCLLVKHSARVRRTQITIEQSELYSRREIEAAVRRVKRRFLWDWQGTLLNVRFSAEENEKAAQAWARQYGADEAIILRSDFVADESRSAFHAGLEPGHTYKNWEWVLVRSGNGGWKLKTWGYG